MRRVKTAVNLDEIRVALAGNRKTRKGEIFLQVAERTQATLLASALKEKLGNCVKVRCSISSSTVLIMGIKDYWKGGAENRVRRDAPGTRRYPHT